MIISAVVLAIDVIAGLVIYRLIYTLGEHEHPTNNSWIRMTIVLIALPALIALLLFTLVLYSIEAFYFERPGRDDGSECRHKDGTRCDCDQ